MSNKLRPRQYADAKGVIAEGFDGNAILGEGATVPSDATAGFAPGCLWFKRAGGTFGGHYINDGTATSCDFNLLSANGVDLSGLTATATELNKNAGVTAGTVTASKTVVVDANKDIASFRNLRTTRLIEAQGAETFDNTVGALTITAAMVLGGTLLRDPNGASRTDVLPTAALLVAGLPGAAVGDIVAFYVVNCADAAETITMSAGSGGTWNVNQPAGARIIPQNTSRWVYARLTNVTSSSEAYSAWM